MPAVGGAGLREALEAGYAVIQGGGASPEAVKAAIVKLEDNPLFNAGKGAVFTTDAKHELDASIMDGETLDTGAVTGVEHIKKPILLADAVRTESRHMFFSGEGAELFATNQGFELLAGAPGGQERQLGLQLRAWHGGRRRARSRRQPRGRDIHGRTDQQADTADRRLARDRGRHLREPRHGRRVRHRNR
jgi:isoaspartyl peptidase/L-asparaginase-like protein (Ntn-hydrolase superfamily)